MKFSSFVPLALVAGSYASVLKDRAVSNNNCGRAVAGTANGAASLSKAKMDCSSNVISYTTVTVTPTASTYTSIARAVSTSSPTITVTFTGSTTSTITTVAVQTITSLSTATSSTTVTVTPSTDQTTQTITLEAKRELENRAATGTIPKYASACTNYAQYVSACAVAGVTQGTSTITATAAAPTTTVTSYTTSISTNLQTASTESDLSFTQTNTISTTTTLNQATTVVGTSTATACVPSVPSGNILVDPGFNDGSFDGQAGWNPGGNGGFSNSIVTDAQCGPYGAQFTVTSSSSYGRIGQRFNNVLDSTKQYQIQTYAKLVSGNPANCYYYVTCQQPGSFSSAGNVIIQTPASSLTSDWTKYLVTCPPSTSSLTMSISLQCNQGTGPVTIGVDETAMYPIN